VAKRADFEWHSAIGVDSIASGQRPVVRRLRNTRQARGMFHAASAGKFLIHKTSQALWRVSDDGKAIEPVFDSDVLTEDDLKETS
jgi:hypothetical protein